MTTEVYSCKEGQALKEGKLDCVPDITTKAQAEPDAIRRCQQDSTIKKVAYYNVTPDGKFRMFYSYTNPNCKPNAPKAEVVRPARRPQPRKPPEPGFWGKIAKALGLGS